jgi:hypothetical protein
MKVLQDDLKENQVEIVEEQQLRKEIKLIGQQRKIRGLTLWEFNTKEKTLQPAKFKKQDFAITTLSTSPEALKISNKVDVQEHCIYFQALNRKNALKKLGLTL